MIHPLIDRAPHSDFGLASNAATEADMMRRIEAARAVPERFATAVREFAGWTGLDADAVLAGQSFEIGGVRFTLVHYGITDPDGATVVVDYGEFTVDNEAMLLRRLLEHNLQTPAGRHGYFGLVPAVNRLHFCIRVDLAKAERGADAIGNVIAMTVESLRGMVHALMKQAEGQQGAGAQKI